MDDLNSLQASIKSVDTNTFESVALQVFDFQKTFSPIYGAFVKELKRPRPKSVKDIPFIPIEFFKNHRIATGDWHEELIFESSGTTGVETSKHFIRSGDDYLSKCVETFESFYGSLEDYVILALLPSYLERGNSGLVSMVNEFIRMTKRKDSGFFLNEWDALIEKLTNLKHGNKKVILWGVTFALLDLAERFKLDFPELIIMETGGMKGRREELTRSEVHQILMKSFSVEHIHSEYGMTELMSQAYSKGNGLFHPAQSMRVIGRQINDPLTMVQNGKTGALNIIDLANLHSCAFIATKDLGKVNKDGSFEVLGRMDNSDVRGCNLLVG